MERGLLHRLFSSLPIIGPAMGLFIEHTEMGIAQHGRCMGLLRGAILGTVLMMSLIAVSECVVFGFDMLRYALEVKWGASIKSDFRVEATKRVDDDNAALLMHIGANAVTVANPTRCYLVDEERVSARSVDDQAPWEIAWLKQSDPGLFVRPPLTLEVGETIVPFFISNSTHDVAVVAEPQKRVKYVFASLGRERYQLVLVPLEDYAISNLPMHENTGGR